MTFLFQLLIGLAMMLIGYILMPKQAKQSDTTQDMEDPTSEASREIPLIRGEMIYKSPNVLWFGDKSYVKKNTNSGKKKKS